MDRANWPTAVHSGLGARLKQAGSSVVACAAHPGVTAGRRQRHSPNMQNMPSCWRCRLPRGSAQLAAATDPAVEPLDYFGPDGLLQMRGYPKRFHGPKGPNRRRLPISSGSRACSCVRWQTRLLWLHREHGQPSSAAIALLALAVIFLAIKEPNAIRLKAQVQQRLQLPLRRQLSRARHGNCASFRPKKAPAGPGCGIAAPCCWRASSTWAWCRACCLVACLRTRWRCSSLS